MQSARVVVLIVAVVCACDPCQTSSVATKQSHPRRNLLNLVRAASGLVGPFSQIRSIEGQQGTAQNSLLYPRSLGTSHAFPLKIKESTILQDNLPEDNPRDEALSEGKISHLDEFQPQAVGWVKRSEEPLIADGQDEVLGSLQQVGRSLPPNFLRNARAMTRPYDVPQIECPPADDQMERFPCPSPDRMGRYRCIDDHVLCDGFIDCPDGEDEDRQQCMFYKTTKAHLDVIADAIIRFIRGRK